jgi:hypothetical protein
MDSPDVVANRAGRMTAGQRLRLLGGEAQLVFLTLVGVAGTALMGPNLPLAYDEGVVLGIAGTIFVAVCAATAIGCGYGVATSTADVIGGGVREVSGSPHVLRSRLPPRFLRGRPQLAPGYALPVEYTYRLEVSGRTFPLSGPAAELLLRHNSSIRVFYGRHSGRLLSVDGLD